MGSCDCCSAWYACTMGINEADIVKWVHRFIHPDGSYRYHRDYMPHMTPRLSEADIHDVGKMVREIPGYEIVSVSKKELFEARLKGT